MGVSIAPHQHVVGGHVVSNGHVQVDGGGSGRLVGVVGDDTINAPKLLTRTSKADP